MPGREQRLFTVMQAAKVLSLGRSTVWQLVRSNRIESVKIGTARRIRREALDAYVASLEGAK
jgi:excisionase family DNA binding protein